MISRISWGQRISENQVGPENNVGPGNKVGPKNLVGPENQGGPRNKVGPPMNTYIDVYTVYMCKYISYRLLIDKPLLLSRTIAWAADVDSGKFANYNPTQASDGTDKTYQVRLPGPRLQTLQGGRYTFIHTLIYIYIYKNREKERIYAAVCIIYSCYVSLSLPLSIYICICSCTDT